MGSLYFCAVIHMSVLRCPLPVCWSRAAAQHDLGTWGLGWARTRRVLCYATMNHVHTSPLHCCALIVCQHQPTTR